MVLKAGGGRLGKVMEGCWGDVGCGGEGGCGIVGVEWRWVETFMHAVHAIDVENLYSSSPVGKKEAIRNALAV